MLLAAMREQEHPEAATANTKGATPAATPSSGVFAGPRRLPQCIRSLAFSGWNPPPAPRRMQGDLAYLRLETLEGPLFIDIVRNKNVIVVC